MHIAICIAKYSIQSKLQFNVKQMQPTTEFELIYYEIDNVHLQF